MSNIVKVEGWVVEEHEGAWSVRDVELAEKVGLARPSNIRSTIAKAIEDGALVDVARGACDMDSPGFWASEEDVAMPRGGSRKATVYRLNEAGAVYMVTRLRTPEATRLTIAVVKVFRAAMRGGLPTPPPPPEPLALAMSNERKAELAYLLGAHIKNDMAREVVMAYGVSYLTGRDVTQFLPALPAGEWLRPTQIGERIGVSAQRVGIAISALGLRGDKTHCRSHLDKKAHSSGEVTVYSYDEWAVARIREHVQGGPAMVPAQG